MKKQLLLSAVLGLASASSLLAATTNDIYITGSTAFRANVYTACTKLFQSAPAIVYGDSSHGGSTTTTGSKAATWCMTGTPTNTLTQFGTNILSIHGLFTGSVQGYKALITKEPLWWVTAGSTYTTNPATIAFSDCSGSSIPYNADGSTYFEDQVAVQPFITVRSVATTGGVTNVNNITWEELQYGIQNGRIPLSSWTYNATDRTNFVYLYQRTLDSGTRRTLLAQSYLPYNTTVPIYLWDYTNNIIYAPSTTNVYALNGTTNASVIGTEGIGVNSDNLQWGAGYIGGGDIKTALNVNNANNQAISYLSAADSQGVGSVNWATAVSYNGVWPTTAGPGISNSASVYNNFAPIENGYYPCWGFEVVVYPSSSQLSAQGGQTCTASEFGSTSTAGSYTAGSFLSIFNAQSALNGGTIVPGSIENEIYLSETVSGSYPNTAIRLAEMNVSRPAVGGLISPK